MLRLAPLAPLFLAAAVPAQEPPRYDVAERVRALAFDPVRFFPDRPRPAIAIGYRGDYDMPVFAIAVRRGCAMDAPDNARPACGQRLTARMIRAPYTGTPERPRQRAYRLIGTLAQAKPGNDDALRRALDAAGLEWVEADVRQCPEAMAQLALLADVRFAAGVDFDRRMPQIVLHPDTVRFDLDDYPRRASYEGWPEKGTAGAWANDFAASLEGCWKPATAPAPWRAAVR